MNRRILLIDADPAFHTTLTQQLGRFRIDVVLEPDADKALDLANADSPTALIVGVEEPDKSGFKVFQRCKKGALAKVPLILVTSSVSPDSFAKHRSLKIHADEYLDKRTLSTDELIGKLDNLIGLGDIEGDELDIPVEVDEIPLADGDMVLEEEVVADADADGAGAEFSEESEQRTVASGKEVVSKLLEQETDAAFDALLGDDEPSMPPPPPKATAPVRHEKPTIPPAMLAEQNAEDGERHDDVLHSMDMIPVEDMAAQVEAETANGNAPSEAEAERTQHIPSLESSAAIALDEEDLQEDVLPEAAPVLDLADAAPASTPELTEAAGVALASDDEVVDDEVVGEEVVVADEIVGGEEVVLADAPGPADPVAPVDDGTFVETETQAEPPRKSGSQSIPDLGLEAVAEDANRDQSGVFDRRALRKIGDLERQVAQLMAEIERTRASADAASKGPSREREFLNLREQITQRDKDLQKAKDALAMRDHELAAERTRAKEASDARLALDGKASELERKAAAEASRFAALEAKERMLTAQLASAQAEVTAKTAAVDAAEQARAQLERDIAAEKALRASNESDAERALRVEREQLLARHQTELTTARSEAADKTATELSTKHAAELDKLHADHAAQLARAKEQVEAAAATASEQQKSIAALTADVERLRSELADATSGQERSIADAAAVHSAALAEQATRHADELAKRDREHAQQRDQDTAAHAAAVAKLEADLERQASTHAAKLDAATKELAQLADEHKRQHDVVAAQHRAEVAKLEADKAETLAQIQRTAAEHAAALEYAAGQYRDQRASDKAAAIKEADTLRAAVEQAKQAGEQALAAAQAEHAKQLAEVTAERAQLEKGLSSARDAHKRTETELASAVQTIAERNAELRAHADAIAARDARIAELRKEIETVEHENQSYQEQVLRAYQKIKTDEAMVARAKKAMAIALTVLDDQGTPKES